MGSRSCRASSTRSPAFSPPDTNIELALLDADSTTDNRSLDVILKGGNDGDKPAEIYYEGSVGSRTTRRPG